MGATDAARVDVPALLEVARQYAAAADIIDAAVRTHLSRLAFDGATAGRAYVGQGNAVRASVDHIAERLRQWARASAEIAATLRASAERYAEADAAAGRLLG